MPVMGFGTWKLPKETCAEMVYQAIAAGYRQIDCACDYGNEREVGDGISRAVKDGLCKREELWVTSKLWNTYHRPEHVEAAFRRSLTDLKLEYLDLYLIHFPISLQFVPFETRYPPEWFFDPFAASPAMKLDPVPYATTWRALEALVDAKLTRCIGVSNLNTGMLVDVMAGARIAPAVLQIESHPYLCQPKLLRLCKELGIAVTAFSPLGAGSYPWLNEKSVLDEPLIRQIADTHGATPAQVLLAWALARGTSPIPKTSSVDRLRQNFASQKLVLSAAEVASISGLDRHKRYNDPGVFCEAAFHTFCPIYD